MKTGETEKERELLSFLIFGVYSGAFLILFEVNI